MKYVVALGLILLGCSPPAPPTVSVSASPVSVTQGECATLTWSSANASAVSIDQGVGRVDPSGSQQICPPSTVQYTITATGDGGSGTAATTVSVIAPPPPPVAQPLVTKLMVFEEAALFEFGKADLKPEGKEKIAAYREQAQGELMSADKVYITGYTDNVGAPEVNATLSLQRAEAVRDTLISLGADASKFEVKGAGADKPVADNSTDEGRAKNRRVEVEVVGVGT